jgi:hypothetical protein
MTLRERIDEDGYALLAGLFTREERDQFLFEWDRLTANNPAPSLLRTDDGSIYGARNLLELWPGVVDRVLTPMVRGVIQSVLDGDCGLVRVLFFDKPPEHSWALPWHRDLRVAVKDNSLPSIEFGKPSLKYGIPHLEAPPWLLERMITLRLHLDAVTEENGPLRVLPGSHRHSSMGEPDSERVKTILADAGDALLMRPLLSHSSNHSLPGCARHRRILHFEFAAVRDLPDGIVWHDFVPL